MVYKEQEEGPRQGKGKKMKLVRILIELKNLTKATKKAGVFRKIELS